MSRFRVNLADPPDVPKQELQPVLPDPIPAKRSGFLKVLKILGILLTAVILVGGLGAFFYWQGVKKTPSYSLALLVDAARRDDKEQLESLIDAEAVVNDFMPQVTGKAMELYGRNLPPQTILKVEQVAAPLIPIIKDRAKMELPSVIREKTAPVQKVPYWMIAMFANRAVDISTTGETATVKSKIADRPLELSMKRDGNIWKVTGMKDDVLARKIAEKIGQDIILAASKGGIKKAAEQLGVKNLDELKNMDIFK